MTKIRLYRGLSSPEFRNLDPAGQRRQKKIWSELLVLRAAGDFSYPEGMDAEIRWLEGSLRLGVQYFTDREAVARAYARREGGSLVSIEVPVPEVLRCFRKEFQNFGRRKKLFELVYAVDGMLLWKKRKAWKLKAD